MKLIFHKGDPVIKPARIAAPRDRDVSSVRLSGCRHRGLSADGCSELNQTASPMTAAMYSALIMAVMARVAAGSWGTNPDLWYIASGALWIAAFGSFALGYGRLLCQSIKRV
ncbi:MAG: NnrS family protein [Paracoccus sp. (in: a-proteobacteria)]|uniref:NnrS family protein n=1 Tax=Paracoccus sp. TaxID=267 RepID=UPI00391878AF